MTASDLLTRYAAMLRQDSVLVMEADGGLSDYSLVVKRARRLAENGAVEEAEKVFRGVAEAVREGRTRE